MKNYLSLSLKSTVNQLEEVLTGPPTKNLPLEDEDDAFPEVKGFNETPIRCKYKRVDVGITYMGSKTNVILAYHCRERWIKVHCSGHIRCLA